MRNILLVIVPKSPRIPGKVLEKVSDISIGIGHVSFASIVVPYLIDKGDLRLIILGLVGAVIFYLLGLWLVFKSL